MLQNQAGKTQDLNRATSLGNFKQVHRNTGREGENAAAEEIIFNNVSESALWWSGGIVHGEQDSLQGVYDVFMMWLQQVIICLQIKHSLIIVNFGH